MAADIITLLASALGVDVSVLSALVEANGATSTTCTATARSTGKACQRPPAKGATVCASHGASVPTRKVTHAVRTEVAAKLPPIGFRANGELARRSAYVVAEALGLGNDYGVLKDLRTKGRDTIVAMLAERGIEAEVVPASQLA